jgi:hypothetical protein
MLDRMIPRTDNKRGVLAIIVISRPYVQRLLIGVSCCLMLLAGTTIGFSGGTEGISSLTPAPGSAERKAILDALRGELKGMHGLEVVFVVDCLKVKNGWAWIHARPQSPDGMSSYEDVSALFVKRQGGWEVAELPCAEVDNPECIGTLDFFVNLMKRFPEVPPDILP